MGQRNWYLLTYDVREAGRLRLTCRVVNNYGIRVQYSVYRCRLLDMELERLRWELARIMTPEDDLMIVRLCPGCVRRIQTKGQKFGWPDHSPAYRII